MERPTSAQDDIARKQYYLTGVIDRLESSVAVIRLDTGHELQWPRTSLPSGIHEGSVVRLLLTTSDSDEAERVRIAKSLLNEILDTSH